MSLRPSTAKWAVVLEGDELDLKEARYLFNWQSDTQVCEIELRSEQVRTTVISTEFESLSDGREVHATAQHVVDLMNGLLFVADLQRAPLRVGSVYGRVNGGQWNGATYLSAHFSGKARFQALPHLDDAPPHPTWLCGAVADDVVADVLAFLRGDPDWFDLYNAFERMRADINSHVGKGNSKKIGWPTTDHFTQSAQVYRHSQAKWPRGYNMANAMQIPEARAFVQSLTKAWLHWRYATHA